MMPDWKISSSMMLPNDIVTAARIGAAQLHDQVDNTVLSVVKILFRSDSRSWPLSAGSPGTSSPHHQCVRGRRDCIK